MFPAVTSSCAIRTSSTSYRTQRAVRYSKSAKSRKKVTVHICRAGEVSKERGAPAGEVTLRRWKAIKVYPDDDTTV